MIIAWSTAYNMKPAEVLYDVSYINLLLYSAATPHYDDKKVDEPQWDDSLDANNPDNF